MIYVVIQFSCIIYLVVNADSGNFSLFLLALIALSLIVGLSAIINMKPKNLNITPSLRAEHQLVTNGIYDIIRHPMYLSVLLLCFALMLSNSHIGSQLVMFILWVNLILKSRLEETLLNERFSDYQAYKNRTGRFLPFL